MKNLLTRLLLSAWCLCAAASWAQNATNPAPTSTESTLIVASGTVEIAKAGTTNWAAGVVNQSLQPGDKVRTGKNSRAMVRLANLSMLRVYELTTLEIQPPAHTAQNPTLDVKNGSVYFFNRDKPQTTEFRTPSASGAIRGTEFNLAVAEDGRMLLTLVDGAVDLQNELGSLELHTGEQASAEPGKAPQKTAAVDAINVIQWTLYYPGVLDPNELGLSDDLKVQLAPALDAYRSGDLVKAVDSYPFDRESASGEDKVLRSQLWLAAGKVDAAQNLLQNLGEGRAVALGEALKEMIAAVKHQEFNRTAPRTLASEWMAASYYQQSRGDLAAALKSAQEAVKVSPEFGFAHERVAELEFSFGHTDAAKAALEKSLALSPRNAQAHALNGFLLAAKNKIPAARAAFDKAIELDGNLGNAWLGRGLVKIKRGDVDEGRKDLQNAVTAEPNRAAFRSYLAKAWSMGRPFVYSWDQHLAHKELGQAMELDPNDPTSYLYSALLNQQQNQINEAVEDLEKSKELNDNRRIFRSKLLLDQDRAVRGANLASVYRDAGMTEYSVREATKAVNSDPANSSAHLFLAESYDELRDPKGLNLRYETPWLNELLLANLLAPVGAGNLSQNISQQEYSKLFETDKFGVSSYTEYQSSGDFLERASQFGTLGNSSYALDFEYRTSPGQRLNNDFIDRYYSAKFKQQITEKDSVFLQITDEHKTTGDLLQYYSQGSGSTTLRTHEVQEPNIFAGYHREWNPGNHTLFLFGRLEDEFDLTDTGALVFTINQFPNGVVHSLPLRTFSQTNHSDFVAYSTELQQIFQTSKNTLIGGGRYQNGETDNSSILWRNPPKSFPPIYNNGGLPGTPVFPASIDSFTTDLERISLYAYDYYQIADPLLLSAGVSYDRVSYPVNTDLPPLTGREDSKDQISPKLGLRYTPFENTTFRAAYTRSLGGLFFDNSVRLEPSQLEGFTQSYRSIIPESVVGAVPGTRFTTYGVGMEQSFKTKTYLTLQADLLESDAERTLGLFQYTAFTPNAVPFSTAEQLRYQERAVTFTANQLLGDDFAVGARYRVADSDLEDVFPQIPQPLVGFHPNRSISATLHQATLYALYYHRCGFFARNEAVWFQQSNRGYAPDIPGDDVWQFNVFVGYRFPRRHAELRLGVLNLFDHDYNLNPLNYYVEYPRERTFVATFKFTF